MVGISMSWYILNLYIYDTLHYITIYLYINGLILGMESTIVLLTLVEQTCSFYHPCFCHVYVVGLTNNGGLDTNHVAFSNKLRNFDQSIVFN